MPAKITFAGENTYKIYIGGSLKIYISSRVETYQTDTPRDGSRKCGEDVHSWVQPLGQSLIAAARIVKFSHLILKDCNDRGGRDARLQLGGKRMCEKVFLCLLLIQFQSRSENGLETRGSLRCGCCLGHDRDWGLWRMWRRCGDDG